MDKKGVLGLFPIYDEQDEELDVKTAKAVAGAFQRAFWADARSVPLQLVGEMLDQGIAVMLLVTPERMKFFQGRFSDQRHVYVAQQRRKGTSVDMVVEQMLKKMKSDGVVRALV